MERIAILDHVEHRLYIEDISDEMLDKYKNNIFAYINDYYDCENFTWEYITEAHYIPLPPPYDDPIEINFNALRSI